MKKVEYAHRLTITELLSQSRDRCCVCHNPAGSVDVYYIDGNELNSTLSNLAILCRTCFDLASSASQFGKERAITELKEYKNQWEQECYAWRFGSDNGKDGNERYSIKILQDGEGQFYKDCEIVYCTYYFNQGDQITIDSLSDELINIRIMKKGSFDRLGWHGKSFIKPDDGYEFHISFTAPQDGNYVVLYCKMGEKVTIKLNVSTSLLSAPQVTINTYPLKAYLESVRERFSPDSRENEEKLYWQILPPGQSPFAESLEHSGGIQSTGGDVYDDEERFLLMKELKPTATYRGLDEFRGYKVFCFDAANIAVLDCPRVGNALYVLKGDWKNLSRLSKKELLKEHTREVTRIVHSGDWFLRLKKLLQELGAA